MSLLICFFKFSSVKLFLYKYSFKFDMSSSVNSLLLIISNIFSGKFLNFSLSIKSIISGIKSNSSLIL